MNIVRHRTPDTGWAWIISLSCGVINGLTFGLIRSFGVFFFYLRREFAISRKVASWPFALCTSVTYLSGPITGLLIAYFHLRTIVFAGIIFTAFGFAACFCITDIDQIVILVGIVHGFGVGLSYMQTPVILAQYFVKYQATATAISYAGGTVGSFLFPPLIEHVIVTYGLRGSFLIIGGVLLNGLPVAMLLRPPIPIDDRRATLSSSASSSAVAIKSSGATFATTSTTIATTTATTTATTSATTAAVARNNAPQLSPRSIRSVMQRLTSKRNSRWLFLRKSSIDLFIEKLEQQQQQQKQNDDHGGSRSESQIISNRNYQRDRKSRFDFGFDSFTRSLDSIKSHKKQAQTMASEFCETEMLIWHSMRNENRTMDSAPVDDDGGNNDVDNDRASTSTAAILQQTGADRNDINNQINIITESPKSPVMMKNKYCQTIPMAKRSQLAFSIVAIITNPMYIILLITHVCFQWAWMTYQMVIFDFGIDQALSRSQSVSILIGFAVSDLFGRITSGWLADRRIIKKNHIVSICILCIGFCIQLTSMISTYRTHLALTIVLGFTCGVIIVLFNLLTMEYVGLDNLPVALGLSAFFVGATSLARPYVIGLFRDVIGSYGGLFRFVGTLSFIAALLWLMEPFAILNFKRGKYFRSNPNILI